MQQPNKPIEKQKIDRVDIHDLFLFISEKIGFTEYDIEFHEEEILDLVEHWRKQGYIEIYEDDADRAYGRIKNMASVNGSVPWYINLYHARITKDNDPLLVVTFEQELGVNDQPIIVASVRFMAIHDDLFGPQDKKVKFNQQTMKAIRKQIDAYRIEGDKYNEQKAKSK